MPGYKKNLYFIKFHPVRNFFENFSYLYPVNLICTIFMSKTKTFQWMKKIFILFFLLSLGTVYVAGQKDTLKIKVDLPSGHLLTDSRIPHKVHPHRLGTVEERNCKRPVYSNAPFGTADDVITPSRSKNFIFPTILISYGLIAQKNERLRALDKSVHRKMSRLFPGRYHVDDYMQYAPYVAYYTLDIGEWKAKHNFRDRTIILMTSLTVMGGTVTVMKSVSGVERPDKTSYTSFPSGHTAMAFLGAHLLFHEYRDASPWIGVAGYTSATTVAILRVRNRKHWISDVIAGAGIGILSAEAGYLLLSAFHNILGINSHTKNLMLTPATIANSYGIGLTCSF
jgi:hypothetical protein